KNRPRYTGHSSHKSHERNGQPLMTERHPKPKAAPKPTGYILQETEDIVVIGTLESENGKTGNMIQVWILLRNTSPVDAVKLGQDVRICLDCKHKGTGFSDRTCYVNVGQGPLSVWTAYRNGNYPFLPISGYAKAFGKRKVRFGAYGEPMLIDF